MAIESRFIQLDRMAFEQSLMAFAATRPCAGALRWHAIGSVAIWTDDMNSVTHRAFLAEEILVIEYGAARRKRKSLRKNFQHLMESAITARSYVRIVFRWFIILALQELVWVN